MEVNERFLKFSSRIPFPDDLLLGEDLTITVKGRPYTWNVVKQEILDKQDGTVDLVFVLKSLSE